MNPTLLIITGFALTCFCIYGILHFLADIHDWMDEWHEKRNNKR